MVSLEIGLLSSPLLVFVVLVLLVRRFVVHGCDELPIQISENIHIDKSREHHSQMTFDLFVVRIRTRFLSPTSEGAHLTGLMGTLAFTRAQFL